LSDKERWDAKVAVSSTISTQVYADKKEKSAFINVNLRPIIRATIFSDRLLAIRVFT
jgi:hypothetical protein